MNDNCITSYSLSLLFFFASSLDLTDLCFTLASSLLAWLSYFVTFFSLPSYIVMHNLHFARLLKHLLQLLGRAVKFEICTYTTQTRTH
jgi:hypothetical protein